MVHTKRGRGTKAAMHPPGPTPARWLSALSSQDLQPHATSTPAHMHVVWGALRLAHHQGDARPKVGACSGRGERVAAVKRLRACLKGSSSMRAPEWRRIPASALLTRGDTPASSQHRLHQLPAQLVGKRGVQQRDGALQRPPRGSHPCMHQQCSALAAPSAGGLRLVFVARRCRSGYCDLPCVGHMRAVTGGGQWRLRDGGLVHGLWRWRAKSCQGCRKTRQVVAANRAGLRLPGCLATRVSIARLLAWAGRGCTSRELVHSLAMPAPLRLRSRLIRAAAVAGGCSLACC